MRTTTNDVSPIVESMRNDAAFFRGIAATTSCPTARLVAETAAVTIDNRARVIAGDLGEEQEEWEIEPLSVPATAPVEAPVPAEPVPVP